MKPNPLSPAIQSKKIAQRCVPLNEFSRILNVHALGIEPQLLQFAASIHERFKIRDRLDLVSLEEFEVTCQISHNFVRGSISIEAVLNARVVQSCVITLLPVYETVRETVLIELLQYGSPEEDNMDSLYDDEPEKVILGPDGTIDLGEIFVQYLSLAVNPYPRLA